MVEENNETVQKTGFVEKWKNLSKAKKALSIVAVCCIGLILIVGLMSLGSDQNTTNNKNTSGSQSSGGFSNPLKSGESEETFKASCQNITFKSLNKNIAGEKGKRVKFYGKVFDIKESGGVTTFQLVVGSNFAERVYVVYPDKISAVDEDYVTIWGEVAGPYTYIAQNNNQITIPQINGGYISTWNELT
ncbi:MAG: hypothetical protein ACRC1M_05225 [Methanobacteriaceae archaeon]